MAKSLPRACKKIVDRLEQRPDLIKALQYEWGYHARREQLTPPGDWRIWLILAGRGFGKTRTGAEWVRESVELRGAKRIALVARTAADARDVMVEGESGILSVCPPWNKPIYEPSKRRVTWPNGAIATTYSADEPNLLRGPQHDAAWVDELASYRRLDTYDQLMFGLRIGANPQCVITTTPRPRRLLREIYNSATTYRTTGSTYDNRANLAKAFFADIVSRYEGTSIGRQELHAELLDEAPGALWQRQTIEASRVHKLPELTRIVVAIDPAVTAHSESDETAIIVGGRDVDGDGYILEDLSGRWTPDQWASRAVAAYRRWRADRIVAEVNNGGDLVEKTLKTVDTDIPYSAVWASRGKRTRAEPIAARYEQGRIHHVGIFAELEDEMCSWVSTSTDPSPNRMDGAVWALTELFEGGQVAVSPPELEEMGARYRV